MSIGSVDRVAVVVEDIEAAAAELRDLFDIEVRIFDVAAIACRVGFCDQGIELIQPLAGSEPLQAAWAGRLATIGLRVPDVDAARAKLSARGLEPAGVIETPGGAREVFYAQGFAGLPVALSAYGDEGFVRAIGADGDTYEPTMSGG